MRKKFLWKRAFFVASICLLMAASFGPTAWAQDSQVAPGTETEAEREKVYMKIGTITVTEKNPYLITADLPASVDVLGRNQIENENVDFSMELFKKIPGTYYGDWNQGVVSGTFSIRGFDANHDVPATLIVDGIPHNFVYGRMDIQPIFPLEIERIELVKGTNDPRYGLQNIAGNVNVHTKRGGNFNEFRFLTGSFNTYDAGMVTGREQGNFSQTYFVGYRQTDGYREHSDLKKGAASGKWFYHTDDQRLSIGAIARVFGMDANAPGYLTKEEAAANPRHAADFARTDGGEQENQHLSLHLDYRFNDHLNWSFKVYGQHLQRLRWCTWNPGGSQQERVNRDDQYGLISTLSYETSNLVFKNLKLDWGVDYQYQDNLDQRWASVDRVRNGPVRDYVFDQNYWGSYIQTDGELTDWLRLIAALRVDRFDGSFENRLANQKSDMIDFGHIWQPKFGLVVTPVQGYNLYANWGRTFQIPVSDPFLYGQAANGRLLSRDLEYSKNDGWEAGLKMSPFNWLSARAGYWTQIATDEIRLKADGSGDYINAGETERKGWDLALSLRPHPWVSLWGSYSLTEAIYTEPGPTLLDRKGKEIENIPQTVAKVGVDFEHPGGFFANCWLEGQGDYYVDPQNLKPKEGGYHLVNLSLGHKFNETLTVGLDIKNLTDETYNAFVWNSDWGYGPGDERSFYGWVKMSF